MPIPKREIQLAQEAMKILRKLTYDDLPYKEQREFKSYLNGLPSSISQNGLLQTMAFMKTKDHKSKALFDGLNEYFKPDDVGSFDFVKYISEQVDDMHKYVLLQKEAIDLTLKIKQLANAFIKQPPAEKK
ncbi:MAG: type III-B CRISPR module-associated protein Cmr5 [bacterium]